MSQVKKILAGQVWSLTKDARNAAQSETKSKIGQNVKIVLFNDDETFEVDCMDSGHSFNVTPEMLERFVCWAPKEDDDDLDEEENFRQDFID